MNPSTSLSSGEVATRMPWRTPSSAASARDADYPFVVAACEGDLTAFDVLFHRYRPQTFRLAMRFLESPDEAEEAVTDAFIRAYRALKSFRGDSQFSTWLYRITVNVCIRRQKKLRRQNAEVQELDDDSPLSSDSGSDAAAFAGCEVESLIEERARQRAVRRAVRSLSPKLRAVVVLHYFEDLPCEQIAEVLGCSVGTVWSRLHAAKAKLSSLLTRELAE